MVWKQICFDLKQINENLLLKFQLYIAVEAYTVVLI